MSCTQKTINIRTNEQKKEIFLLTTTWHICLNYVCGRFVCVFFLSLSLCNLFSAGHYAHSCKNKYPFVWLVHVVSRFCPFAGLDIVNDNLWLCSAVTENWERGALNCPNAIACGKMNVWWKGSYKRHLRLPWIAIYFSSLQLSKMMSLQ